MQIRVRLSGFLKRQGLPSGRGEGMLTVAESATVGEALDLLGVSAQTPYLVTRNGARTVREQPLREGDTLTIIPPISGGK